MLQKYEIADQSIIYIYNSMISRISCIAEQRVANTWIVFEVLSQGQVMTFFEVEALSN